MSDRQPLMTPEQVSKLIGVNVDTLAVWRCTGRYNLSYVKVGRKPMYQPDVVDMWLQKRTVRGEE